MIINLFSLRKENFKQKISLLLILITLQGCSTLGDAWDGTMEAVGLKEVESPQPAAEKEKTTPETKEIARGEEVAPRKEANDSASKINGPKVDLKTTSGPITGGLEIMWQVPLEPVETYYISLSNSTTGEPDKQIKLPVGKLKKQDDPTYGPVYRYVLPNTVRGRAGIVQIRAENRFGISEPSEPIIVEK